MAEPSDYLPVSACPILCDADCEVDCHAQHIPMFQRQRAKREGWPLDAGHMVEDCPSQRAVAADALRQAADDLIEAFPQTFRGEDGYLSARMYSSGEYAE